MASRYDDSSENIPDLIIGADTSVVQNGEIFGKPKSRAHAIEMITR